METDDITKDLNELQKQIAEGKRKVAQLEGRKEEQMKRLKADFGVASTAEAQKLLEKKQGALDKATKSITMKYESLKKQFDWS